MSIYSSIYSVRPCVCRRRLCIQCFDSTISGWVSAISVYGDCDSSALEKPFTFSFAGWQQEKYWKQHTRGRPAFCLSRPVVHEPTTKWTNRQALLYPFFQWSLRSKVKCLMHKQSVLFHLGVYGALALMLEGTKERRQSNTLSLPLVCPALPWCLSECKHKQRKATTWRGWVGVLCERASKWGGRVQSVLVVHYLPFSSLLALDIYAVTLLPDLYTLRSS